MKVTVVCGLLGSGKTTFIQNLLANNSERVVVLVNDFGKTGIDGELFSSNGIESIELPSGCVCCTLKSDMISTIEKIISKFSPEHIVIEPSGIASPSGVLEALDLLKITPVTVIGIVDVTEFIDLYEAEIYGSFFRDQIVNSDIVLINKTDLEDEEKISGTLQLIEQINPGAVTFRTVRAILKDPVPDLPKGQHRIQKYTSHLHFDTASFSVAMTAEFSFYKRIFEDMKEGIYGNIVRAKSLVNTDKGPFRFDLSYGTIDATPLVSLPNGSRVVVIGERLEKEALYRAFEPLNGS